MAMTLTSARTRLLRLVDDETDRVRFPTDQELDDALGTGQQEAYSAAVAANRDLFQQETALTTTSAGVGDLTSIKPLMPLGPVSMNQNGWRLKVPPGRLDDGLQNVTVAVPLLVNYVARAVFPSAGGNNFVWGSANFTQTNLLDQLMLTIAAGELLIKDGTINQMLEKRKDELRVSVASQLSGTGWTVVPLDALTGHGAPESFYQYIMTAPDTLQLAIRRW